MLLPKLREVAPDARVCVVDDNSPDRSGDVARELGIEDFVRTIVRKGKRGYGTAVRVSEPAA